LGADRTSRRNVGFERRGPALGGENVLAIIRFHLIGFLAPGAPSFFASAAKKPEKPAKKDGDGEKVANVASRRLYRFLANGQLPRWSSDGGASAWRGAFWGYNSKKTSFLLF